MKGEEYTAAEIERETAIFNEMEAEFNLSNVLAAIRQGIRA